METDALHQLSMMRSMQLLIGLLAWAIRHATQNTCAAMEPRLQVKRLSCGY